MMKTEKTEAGSDSNPPGSEETQGNPPESLTPEAIADLRGQAEKGREHWDMLVRVTADFDNYKKRAARERTESVKFANESLLQKLVPILDTFDMALAAAASAKEGTAQSLQTGVSMILSQLKGILMDSGLEEIDATGKVFDPNIHEAVSQQESADVPEGHVLQQLRKGYRLKERLLRPATVIVAEKPGA